MISSYKPKLEHNRKASSIACTILAKNLSAMRTSLVCSSSHPGETDHWKKLWLEQLGSRKLQSLRHLLSTNPLLRKMFTYTQNRLKRGAERLLPSQRQHTHLLRGPGDITVLANKTVPRDTNVLRFTTATRDTSVSGDSTVPLGDSPGLPPRVLDLALTPNVPVFQTRPLRGLDGLTLPPMPPCHTPINAILTGQAPLTRPLIEVYSIITSDESDHALRPRDPTMLKTYVDAAQHAFGHAAPLNTQSANRTGCNLWVNFLAEFGGATPALRRPGTDGQLRENIHKSGIPHLVPPEMCVVYPRPNYNQAKHCSRPPSRRKESSRSQWAQLFNERSDRRGCEVFGARI